MKVEVFKVRNNLSLGVSWELDPAWYGYKSVTFQAPFFMVLIIWGEEHEHN